MAINYKDIYVGASTADVQRKNNFTIQFTHLGETGLQMYLQTFPFPKTGNVVKDVRTGNLVSKYAGAFESTENVTVQYREYLDRKTSKQLMVWRNKVGNQATGDVYLSENYKIDGVLTKELPFGNGADSAGVGEIDQWDLKRCWLSDYKEEDYDQSNDGDLVLVSCTLVVEQVLKKTS